MKVLANSVGAATIIALGLQPGANGESLPQGTAVGAAKAGGRDHAAIRVGETLQELAFRRLQTADHRVDSSDDDVDDALDFNGGVSDPFLQLVVLQRIRAAI